MNTLPSDIIIAELFPKLQLSNILELIIAYPPWLPLFKKYICNIGKELCLDHLKDHRDIFKSFLYKENIQSRFFYIKTFIPLIVHLLTISYERILGNVETDLNPQIQTLYPEFESDMNSHLDVIYSKTIINPQTLLYIQRNKPKDGLTNEHPDSRILKLFPTFYPKLEQLIMNYLIKMETQSVTNYFLEMDRQSVIQEFRSEINMKLYRVLNQD